MGKLALPAFVLALTVCSVASAAKTPSVDPATGKVVSAGPLIGEFHAPTAPDNIPVFTFSNPALITINDLGTATPYPSVITVSGAPTQAFNLRVTLTGVNHTFPGDLDILLVGPSGGSVILLSDTGGATDAVNANVTFDDAAPAPLTTVVTGTFKPTNTGAGDTWPAPAPAGPYGATMAAAAAGNPNGQWRLFVLDTAALDVGTITGGWSLTFEGPYLPSATITAESCAPANGALDPGETASGSFCIQNQGAVASGTIAGALQASGGIENPSPAQSYGSIGAGQTVCRTFTFNVDLAATCGSTVTATVAYTENGNPIGNGTTSFTLGALGAPQGFANPTPILVPGAGTSGPAAPYPSTINVAGFVGNLAGITVTLTNINHTFPDDVDVLLVSPSGAKVLLLSDAGGSTDAVNQTLTFDDAAAGVVPDSGPLVSGTFRPSNFGTGDTFPAPAPAAPYGSALAGFLGVSPNGTWSLYIVDDVGGDVGNVNGGWSLSLRGRTCCTGACSLVAPPNVTQGNDPGQCGAAVTYAAPTVTGICGLVACAPPPGSFFPVGTTTVTCDPEAAGANSQHTVTVNDVEAPVIGACPADIVITDAPPGALSLPVDYTAPGATDNCSATVDCQPPSGDPFPVGTTTPVVCTASDPGGNTAACAFNVIISALSIQEIPTVGQFGLLALTGLLGAAGALALRRRRR